MDFQKKSTKVLVSVIAIIAILAVGLGIKYYKSLNDMSVGKFILGIVTRIMFENENYDSLKTGSDLAAYVLEHQQEGSPALAGEPYLFKLDTPSSIRYDRPSPKGNFVIVISFYKEDQCSIDKKNCYIYYYQTLGDEKPELLAKAYFGDDKKVEYVDIKDKN